MMKCMTASMTISQSENEEQDQPPPPEKKVQSGHQIRQQRRGSTKDLNNQSRYESSIAIQIWCFKTVSKSLSRICLKFEPQIIVL